VVNGKVERVVPLLGSKFTNRDGTITSFKDIVVKHSKTAEETMNLSPSSRDVDPKGYR